ncbi:TPA: HNH endonuclease [Photobacterium damselae]
MARLEQISNVSWKQPLKDRKKEFHLWNSQLDVRKSCDLQDGTKRLLSIEFDNAPELNVIDKFQITSGKEISFTKDYQNLIKPFILSKKTSFFIVTVLDSMDEGNISTTGLATVKTRIGQTIYRQKLLDYWNNKCAVTGLSITPLLMASHIKPWCVSNDEERLDKYNGLLLNPTLDKLFDQGYITFQNNGMIEISPLISDSMESLDINPNLSIKFEDEHNKYLQYHREHIFKKK